jgi:hypothetical protein
MIHALRGADRGSHSHNSFDLGARLRFDAAIVTKIKISPEPQNMFLYHKHFVNEFSV